MISVTLDIKTQNFLISNYLWGFVDELNKMGNKVYVNSLSQKAYNSGRYDARLGNAEIGWMEREYPDILADILE